MGKWREDLLLKRGSNSSTCRSLLAAGMYVVGLQLRFRLPRTIAFNEANEICAARGGGLRTARGLVVRDDGDRENRFLPRSTKLSLG